MMFKSEAFADQEERVIAGRLIDAALGAFDEPYLPPVRPGMCVAAALAADGTVWTERTLLDADGWGGSAHALRAAVSKYRLTTDSPRPGLILAAIIEQTTIRRQLVLPCGACRELLAAHADPKRGLAVIGASPDVESLVKFTIGALLPCARGNAKWFADIRHLRDTLPKGE